MSLVKLVIFQLNILINAKILSENVIVGNNC